jgi:hypothetical protein
MIQSKDGAELWLRLLYGQAYAGNANLVAWWGLYYLIGFGQRPFSIGLRVLGNTRGIFYGTVGGATIALTLSYPQRIRREWGHGRIVFGANGDRRHTSAVLPRCLAFRGGMRHRATSHATTPLHAHWLSVADSVRF